MSRQDEAGMSVLVKLTSFFLAGMLVVGAARTPDAQRNCAAEREESSPTRPHCGMSGDMRRPMSCCRSLQVPCQMVTSVVAGSCCNLSAPLRNQPSVPASDSAMELKQIRANAFLALLTPFLVEPSAGIIPTASSSPLAFLDGSDTYLLKATFRI